MYGFRRSLMKNSFPIVNLDNYVTSDYVRRNPDKVDYETYPIMEEYWKLIDGVYYPCMRFTFTKVSQGVILTSSSYAGSIRKYSVDIQHINVTVNGQDKTSTLMAQSNPNLGFYKPKFFLSSGYYYLTDKTISDYSDYNGIQFQVSSSYTGEFPVVIEFVAKITFS